MGRLRRALGVQKPKNKDPAVMQALRTSLDNPNPVTRKDSLDPDLMAAILASTKEAQPAYHPTQDHGRQAAPNLSRAFSQANPKVAAEVREQRSALLRQTPSGVHFFDEPPSDSALVLPGFEGSTQLRDLVVAQLENGYLQREAEREGIINRPSIRPFTSHQIALNTEGDGNCLSHACSLGIWGVHDHDRLLRRALLGTFQSPKAGAQLRQRFEYQLASQGLPADSWAAEWRSEVEALQTAQGFSNKFLADIHCFCLANVLRHPIIIYGDKMAAMSGLAGIYLPLLWEDSAGVCSRAPVTVLYHSNHFSLLAVIEGEGPITPPLIPLSTSDSLLPVRFLLPQEQDADGAFPSGLIGKYMDIEPMKEGQWGIRLPSDPVPNSLFALLEGAFIRELAASKGLPEEAIPCAWASDSPACKYTPSRNAPAPPMPSIIDQPANVPGTAPPRSPLARNGPGAQSAPHTSPWGNPPRHPTHPAPAPPAFSQSGYPPTNPYAAGHPALSHSMHSTSASSSLGRSSAASTGSSGSAVSPFADQTAQEWAVPRQGTQLDAPTDSLQGLSLLSQQAYLQHGNQAGDLTGGELAAVFPQQGQLQAAHQPLQAAPAVRQPLQQLAVSQHPPGAHPPVSPPFV